VLPCDVSCDFSPGPVVTIYQGDLLPTYTADARSCSEAFDFTGWTMTFEMSGPVTITGAATGSSDGTLTYAWVAGDTDIPGEYAVTFHGVSPSPESKPRTFVVPGMVEVVAVGQFVVST
jgi:hypothetical protein